MCGPLYCISNTTLSSTKLPIIFSWKQILIENIVILLIRVLEEERRNHWQWYWNSLLALFLSFDFCKCQHETYGPNFSQFQTESY